MDELKRIQNWYKQNCNGIWEHQFGIKIDTLDNPGWSLTVDLDNTGLEHVKFKEVVIDRSEDDWINSKINEKTFVSFGGPENLAEMLEIFLNWAEKQMIDDPVDANS